MSLYVTDKELANTDDNGNDITNERKGWHNLKALFDTPHAHKFEQAMIADPANDDVYFFGKCRCGATES